VLVELTISLAQYTLIIHAIIRRVARIDGPLSVSPDLSDWADWALLAPVHLSSSNVNLEHDRRAGEPSFKLKIILGQGNDL